MRFGGTQRIVGLACLAMAATLTAQARAAIIITEVSPTSSGNSTYKADWFELTNTGATAQDITGWKIDDNSNAFASAVAIRGLTSIAAGQSVVFVEGSADGTGDSTLDNSFKSAWFGANVPAGFTIANYGGAGVGLGNGGDQVNIFDSAGNPVTGVTFGNSTTGVSFDNAAGLGGTTNPPPTISTLSVVGTNGAFNSVTGSEVGSPGLVPEPSTFILGGMGLVGLVGLKVRRKKSN